MVIIEISLLASPVRLKADNEQLFHEQMNESSIPKISCSVVESTGRNNGEQRLSVQTVWKFQLDLLRRVRLRRVRLSEWHGQVTDKGQKS